MDNNIKSKKGKDSNRTMNDRQITTTVAELIDEKFYRVADLQAILENIGLNYSIYTIRDYETFKCLNYECGKRYIDEVEKCSNCGSEIRPPLIPSPRTRGGGRGVGHRRYTGADIKQIIEIFKQRS